MRDVRRFRKTNGGDVGNVIPNEMVTPEAVPVDLGLPFVNVICPNAFPLVREGPNVAIPAPAKKS